MPVSDSRVRYGTRASTAGAASVSREHSVHSRERLLAGGWTDAEIDELDGFSEDLREAAIATRKPGADPVRSLRASARISADTSRVGPGDQSRRNRIMPAETPLWTFGLDALFAMRRR
jgi:hypothetical protein